MKQKTDLISIIIPCYNSENFIRDCIESALAQSYRNIEIIVVNDGSKDATLSIVEEFGKTIKVVNTDNNGAAAARNIGLTFARGKWVQFLDSDDILLPHDVEDKLSLSLLNDNDTLICSPVESMEANRPLPKWWIERKTDLKSLIVDGTPATPSPLHQRALLHKIGGFDTSLPRCQEFDLHLRLALLLKINFVYTKITGSKVRIRHDSISRSNRSSVDVTRLQIIKKISTEMELFNHSTDAQEYFGRLAFQIFRSLYQRGDLIEAEKALEFAIKSSKTCHVGAYSSVAFEKIALAIGARKFEHFRKIALSCVKVNQGKDRNKCIGDKSISGDRYD